MCLDPAAARYELFSYTEQDYVVRVDPHDHGNVDSRLEPCRRPAPNIAEAWQEIAALPGVEQVPRHDGRISLRVRGIEFAELAGGELWFGIRERRPALEYHKGEIARLAEELDRARSPEADRESALYRQYPEAWLESQARAQIAEAGSVAAPPNRSTDRCRHSREASAALWICWRWIAAGGSPWWN